MAEAMELRGVFSLANRAHQRLAEKYAELSGYAAQQALATDSKLDADDWATLAYRLGVRGVEMAKEGDRAEAFGQTFIVKAAPPPEREE